MIWRLITSCISLYPLVGVVPSPLWLGWGLGSQNRVRVERFAVACEVLVTLAASQMFRSDCLQTDSAMPYIAYWIVWPPEEKWIQV